MFMEYLRCGDSVANTSLMRGRYLHVLAILRYRAPGYLDALRLKPLRDLLVGKRMAGIFFLDHFFHPSLEDQQRSSAAGGSLHGFREEIAQLEDALRSMRVFAGDSAAHGGWMNADLLGDLLDHHRLEPVDAVLQKLRLTAHNRMAHLQNGLLPLLDILHELEGRGISLFNVVADLLARLMLPIEHAAILRIEAKLRDVLVVQLDQIFFAVFKNVDIRFD